MLEVESIGQLAHFLEHGQELCGAELEVACTEGEHDGELFLLGDGDAVNDVGE